MRPEANERETNRGTGTRHTELNTRNKTRTEALNRRYTGKLELRAPQGATPIILRMQAQTATRFDDVLSHTSPSRGRVAGAAVWSPYGTRPEYGTRGISHPRNGRAPAGVPPTNRSLLALREDGGVVRSSDGAPFAHPVSCLF